MSKSPFAAPSPRQSIHLFGALGRGDRSRASPRRREGKHRLDPGRAIVGIEEGAGAVVLMSAATLLSFHPWHAHPWLASLLAMDLFERAGARARTGAPQAIASPGGRPNPSVRDGKGTRARRDRDRAGRRHRPDRDARRCLSDPRASAMPPTSASVTLASRGSANTRIRRSTFLCACSDAKASTYGLAVGPSRAGAATSGAVRRMRLTPLGITTVGRELHMPFWESWSAE